MRLEGGTPAAIFRARTEALSKVIVEGVEKDESVLC